MRGIELRQLRYFSILAKELHFGRAAELAFVTQPALSQQIAKLEETVGTPLFVRDARQVKLTASGQALRDGVEKALAQIEQAMKLARDANGDKHYEVSVGLVEYTNLPFVPPSLIRLQALYPDVKVHRHEMNAALQFEALAKRQIDVGLGVPVSPIPSDGSLNCRPLLTSGWALVMRDNDRLASLERLRVEDLASERLIICARAVNAPLHDAVVGHCRTAGFVPNFVYETMQAQVGVTLVQQGLGLMLGATYIFADLPAGLTYRMVDGLDTLVVHMFWRSEEANPLVLDFTELVVEEAKRVQLRLAPSDPQPNGA